jgi:hypothetical protein
MQGEVHTGVSLSTHVYIRYLMLLLHAALATNCRGASGVETYTHTRTVSADLLKCTDRSPFSPYASYLHVKEHR